MSNTATQQAIPLQGLRTIVAFTHPKTGKRFHGRVDGYNNRENGKPVYVLRTVWPITGQTHWVETDAVEVVS